MAVPATMPGRDLQRLPVAARRAGLLGHGPNDVYGACQETEALEVPEQAHRPLARCGQPFGVESFCFVI